MHQQGCGQLSSRVLYGDMPLCKARQTLHRHCFFQLQTMGTHRFGQNPKLTQLTLVIQNTVMPDIDSQSHWGRVLCSLQKFLPMFGVFMLQTLNPPSRMIPARLELPLSLFDQVISFAQESSQTGIDEPTLCACLFLLLRGFNRLIDQCVDGIWCI